MLSTFLVIALATPVPPPAAHLHIELAFADGAAAAIDTLIAGEAARVWEPYGVAVSVASGTAEADCRAVTVHVEILDKPPGGVNDHALGSIVFLNGAPDPAVSLYGGTASELVASVVGGSMSQWTTAYRNAVIGRVLGRALAHEIGHYLLHTREHSATGLMRAVQPIDELMRVEDARMVLSPREQALLRDTWPAEFESDQRSRRFMTTRRDGSRPRRRSSSTTARSAELSSSQGTTANPRRA